MAWVRIREYHGYPSRIAALFETVLGAPGMPKISLAICVFDRPLTGHWLYELNQNFWKDLDLESRSRRERALCRALVIWNCVKVFALLPIALPLWFVAVTAWWLQ